MRLATEEEIEKVRDDAVMWLIMNNYNGYGHVRPIMEFTLNLKNLTMYEEKVTDDT